MVPVILPQPVGKAVQQLRNIQAVQPDNCAEMRFAAREVEREIGPWRGPPSASTLALSKNTCLRSSRSFALTLFTSTAPKRNESAFRSPCPTGTEPA